MRSGCCRNSVGYAKGRLPMRRASGGTEEEALVFSRALLARLDRLRDVVRSADASVVRTSASG